MRRLFMPSLRSRIPALLAVIAIGVAVCAQCFVEPIVGTADNRDYWRVLVPLGIDYSSDPEPAMFRNLLPKWSLGTPHPVAYLTSQVWIGKLALVINRLFGEQGVFDIRAMGLANASLYVAASACLLFALRGGPWLARLILCGALAVILSDVRIVAYFNSFYSESAQAIFFLAFAGLALHCSDPVHASRTRLLAWTALVLAAAAFIVAKNQDATYAPALAIAAFVLVPETAPRPRSLGLLAAAALCLLPVWAMASGAYAATTGMNVAVTLHEGILPLAPDPGKVVADLGGDLSRVTQGDLVRFYVDQPRIWLDLVLRQSQDMHSYLEHGNFTRPWTGMSHSFDAWSELKKAYYPRSLTVSVMVVVVCTLLLLRAVMRAASREARARFIVVLSLLWANVLQFLVVVSLEANGPAKHFFIFNLVSDCLLVFAMAHLRLPRALNFPSVRGWRKVSPSAAE